MATATRNSKMLQYRLDHAEIKRRVYQSLCHYGVAVFSDDIINLSALALCDIHLPATGIELLKILIELTQDGKMVIWKDGEAYGFLPIKTWQREMAAIKSPLRTVCEAMRLRGGGIAQLQTTMTSHIVSTLMPASQLPDKPAQNPLEGRQKDLNKPPDNSHRKGNHDPS